MNKTEMEKIISIFAKWFERAHGKDYTILRLSERRSA
jgi:hypothetical protein